jgi:hypothetical protein
MGRKFKVSGLKFYFLRDPFLCDNWNITKANFFKIEKILGLTEFGGMSGFNLSLTPKAACLTLTLLLIVPHQK